MLIFGADREIAAWVGEQLGIRDFGVSSAIGVARGSKIVAGAVFSNFRWPNIEITFAATTPKWATRQVCGAIMRYPFIQLDCRRVTAVTEATNQPARAFLCRFGFREEGIHPDALPSGDAVTYGLLRRECRWIAEEEIGKIRTIAAAAA